MILYGITSTSAMMEPEAGTQRGQLESWAAAVVAPLSAVTVAHGHRDGSQESHRA